MNFNPYQLIDHSEQYFDELIQFLDKGYKFLGYSGLELDSLDSDLNEIRKNYSEPSCFKLLLDEGKIIATVAVKISGEESEIKRVFVDENYQGQGLGKKLSLWAFDYAKAHGAKIMHIWSGTRCDTAHKLYQALGGIDQGTKRLLGGVDNVEEYYFLKQL